MDAQMCARCDALQECCPSLHPYVRRVLRSQVQDEKMLHAGAGRRI